MLTHQKNMKIRVLCLHFLQVKVLKNALVYRFLLNFDFQEILFIFTFFVSVREQWSKALWLTNLIGKKLLLFLASKKALYDAENILITLFSTNANTISKFMISSLMINKEAHSMQANTTFLRFFCSVLFTFCAAPLTLCIDRVMLAKFVVHDPCATRA